MIMSIKLFLFLLFIGLSNLHAQQSTRVFKSVDFIQDGLAMPLDLAYVDGWLFVYELYSRNHILVFDAKSGQKMMEFGSDGRGPGEYQTIAIQKGPGKTKLEVVDTGNKKIDIYDVPCLKSLSGGRSATSCIEQTALITATRHAVHVQDSMILNHSTSPEVVLSLSQNGRTSRSLAEIPAEVIRKYNRPNHAAMSMTGRLTASLDRIRFAYFADSFDYALFFQRSDTTVNLVHEQKYTYLPSFDVQEFDRGSAVFQPDEDFRYAYGSPDAGLNNIYVLYSGKQSTGEVANNDADWRTFTNQVNVYNWEGAKLGQILLDKEVFNIAVSTDESSIFGIHFDKEMNPTVIKAMGK